MIDIAIITVLYNHTVEKVYNWLELLLQNFYYCKCYNIVIYIVNNGDLNYDFNSFNDIKGLNNYKILYYKSETNLGYCGGNNYPLTVNFDNLMIPKVVFIINPDMYIHNSLVFDWMYSFSLQRNAITGLYQDGKSWLTFPAMFPTDKKYENEELPFAYNFNPQHKWPNQNWKSLPYIDGSLMCLPYEVYKLGFDTDFMPGYFGETALQFKAQHELNVKLVNVPIKNMINHKCESDIQYGFDTKQSWTKLGREIFYKNYALPNYDDFLKYLV